MEKNYFIATNRWGCGRSMENFNEIEIHCYETKEDRDADFDAMNYERTGCTIVGRSYVESMYGHDFVVLGDDQMGYFASDGASRA